MILTLIALLLLCIPGIGFGRHSAYDGYLSKKRTDAIKGICIILVFITHIKTYIINSGYVYSGIGDTIFKRFFEYAGQLIVVMFLFYSGYGVMEGIRLKGESYVKSMPRHRILSTLLNFDIAVFVFAIVDFLLGIKTTPKQFLLSLIAWESMGNSNWYIFAILICYISTWICAIFLHNNKNIGWVAMFVLTCATLILYQVKPSWWYDTLLAYPTGILFSLHKKQAECFLEKHYLPMLVSLLTLFFILHSFPIYAKGMRPNLLSIVFAILVVMLSMRIRINNGVLRWCGTNLFPLYIYQRIPMIVLSSVLPAWMLNEQPLFFIVICSIITVIIAYMYKFFRVSL